MRARYSKTRSSARSSSTVDVESNAEDDVEPWRMNVPEDGDGKGEEADIDDFRPEEPPGDETGAGRRCRFDDDECSSIEWLSGAEVVPTL